MKSPYIAVAVKAARRAASEITRAATSLDTLEVENKSVNDFVTAADRAALDAAPPKPPSSTACSTPIPITPF